LIPNIPILFVRYAPGAAGNFFISVLQTSTQVAHWNPAVEKSKGTENFESTYKIWFQKSFQQDLKNHLKYEPHHAHCLDFFSSKHPRGNDITAEQFISNLRDRNDQLFLDNIINNKLTIMRLNKPVIPKFGANNTVINIIVDASSKKWFYRTRCIKLFGHDSQGWISKENHPEFLQAKFKKVLFHNQYCFQVSKFAFLKDFVIGEPAIQPFTSEQALLHDSSNLTCNQLSLPLSIIFNREKFLVEILEIFTKLNLGEPNLDLIGWAYDHYYASNIIPVGIN
jgi:hypothetical protein